MRQLPITQLLLIRAQANPSSSSCSYLFCVRLRGNKSPRAPRRPEPREFKQPLAHLLQGNKLAVGARPPAAFVLVPAWESGRFSLEFSTITPLFGFLSRSETPHLSFPSPQRMFWDALACFVAHGKANMFAEVSASFRICSRTVFVELV